MRLARLAVRMRSLAPGKARCPAAFAEYRACSLPAVVGRSGCAAAAAATAAPSFHFRHHEAPVHEEGTREYTVTCGVPGFPQGSVGDGPPVADVLHLGRHSYRRSRRSIPERRIPVGDSAATIRREFCELGYIGVDLAEGDEVALVASTEAWGAGARRRTCRRSGCSFIAAVIFAKRRSPVAAREGFGADLVFAADQFMIHLDQRGRLTPPRAAAKSSQSSPAITGSPTGNATR